MIRPSNRLTRLAITMNTAGEQEIVYDYCSSLSEEEEHSSIVTDNNNNNNFAMMRSTQTPLPNSSLLQDDECHKDSQSPVRESSIVNHWNEESEISRDFNHQYQRRRRRCHTKKCAATVLVSSSKWIMTPMVITTLLLLIFSPTATDGALSCDTDEDCDTLVGRPGKSRCLESTKTCSNPFQQGCFKTLLPDDERFQMGRICNSDDYNDDDGGDNLRRQGLCYQPDFVYDEIRVHNGNWESSIFLSWIMQILLMEVVQVPVTVGLTLDSTKASSFYNEESTLPYSAAGYPWDALEEANRIGDCRLAFNETRQCIHVMPEVWNGQKHEWSAALQGTADRDDEEESDAVEVGGEANEEESAADDEDGIAFTGSSGGGYIDPIEGNGQVGKGSWYVPSFTADRDDTLVSFYGLSGEENRDKLADAFRRPTSWLEYCEDISDSNCTEADDIATRYPSDESEQSSYFAGDGSYIGYFRLTESNNCTLNPTTCVGHIIGPPCTWSTNVDGQLYWNNIVGMAPDGPVLPNGGYDYGSMIQIWRAANWTKSNVMFWWWRPDALVEEFHGSDSQFQQVLLPEATDVCSRSRVDTVARCSEDIMERRGSPEGACDQEAHALQKIFAKSLRERTMAVGPTLRSPGYNLLQNLKVTDLEINNMIRRWLAINTDRYGNDAREAVCGWMVDNLDTMLDFTPQGYPRVFSKQSSYDTGFLYAAQAVAGFTTLVVMVSTAFTILYRKTKVFVFAQVYFCGLILFGFILICIGSIVTTLVPNSASCTARVWFVTLGYTIELVPLLVKIATINQVLQSAKKMRRVQISPKNMMIRVAAVLVAVMAYLLQWSIWDTPSQREYFRLQSEQSSLVLSSLACSSERFDYWYLIALGWQTALLIMASVLAYQSRHVLQEFNESRSLGTMAYSHFLFVVLRTILFFLGRQPNDTSSNNAATFEPPVVAAASSFLLSLDALFAMAIYIFPKFMEAKVSPEEYDPQRGQSILRNSVAMQGAATGGRQSVAMSNISMIESRAAAARQSFLSTKSGISAEFGGPSGDFESKTRRPSDGTRSWLFKRGGSGGSGGNSMLSSSDSIPFDSPNGGKRNVIDRNISRVNEVSCESAGENISSQNLTPASSSRRNLQVGDEFVAPLVDEPIVEGENEVAHDEIGANENEAVDQNIVDEVDLANDSGSRVLQESVGTDRIVPLRLSSLKSMPKINGPEISDGHSSVGSFDSVDDYDVGGPQWSKPELNVELNRSCRSINPRGSMSKTFSGSGRGFGFGGKMFNRSSPSLGSKRPSFKPGLAVIKSPKLPSKGDDKSSMLDSWANDGSSTAEVNPAEGPKQPIDATESQPTMQPPPPPPMSDSETELTPPPAASKSLTDEDKDGKGARRDKPRELSPARIRKREIEEQLANTSKIVKDDSGREENGDSEVPVTATPPFAAIEDTVQVEA